MFGFFTRRQREEVRRVLSRHMNRDFLKKFRYGKRRDARGSFCQVAWVIPCDPDCEPQFDAAFPAITKDISPEGLSLVHTQPVTAARIVIGLGDDALMSFVSCTLGHTTPMGAGFYQIGMDPQQVIRVSAHIVRRLLQRGEELMHGGLPMPHL